MLTKIEFNYEVFCKLKKCIFKFYSQIDEINT
jgi:hypothetical protein